MVLTREFKLTVRARVQGDAAFRKELLRESVESFLAGDVDTGKTILRDYINATIGFEKLAKITHHSPKSLMRMRRLLPTNFASRPGFLPSLLAGVRVCGGCGDNRANSLC